jgi:hypothetical protein
MGTITSSGGVVFSKGTIILREKKERRELVRRKISMKIMKVHTSC